MALWAWCFAHRLELACKDSFISEMFTNVTDMLLRLYYLYSKSPKTLVSDFGEVFELLLVVGFHTSVKHYSESLTAMVHISLISHPFRWISRSMLIKLN